jgi:hypothetical protein
LLPSRRPRPLFYWILPRSLVVGDRLRNQARQAALDRASMSSGHVADVIFDMFERFEGR